MKTHRYDVSYLDIAVTVSELSHDSKIKVGCIIVKDGQILSQGWNGMPSGMDNSTRDGDGKTKREVLHAESNALMKLTKQGGGSKGATIYSTHSPCYDCAKLLVQAGITTIVYTKPYCTDALTFLNERGIHVKRINPSRRVSD